MARGINKAIIVGHLGQDPDVRQMPSGGNVTNMNVATAESWTDNQGQRQERTEWHRVVMFNKLAEIAGQYLRKGSQVYIEGSLRTRQWEKDGVQRYTTEIVARDMQMLGGRPGSSNDGAPYQPPTAAPQQPTQSPRNSAPNNPPEVDFGDLDDDLPF